MPATFKSMADMFKNEVDLFEKMTDTFKIMADNDGQKLFKNDEHQEHRMLGVHFYKCSSMGEIF